MKTLLLLTAASLSAASDKLLDAVAQVESRGLHAAVGDAGKALSAYQLHPGAWEDANRLRERQGLPRICRSRWSDPAAARQIASAYLDLMEARLRDAGAPTDYETIYLAYSMGFESYRRTGFSKTELPAHKLRALDRLRKALAK